jgi:hypothetical protein
VGVGVGEDNKGQRVRERERSETEREGEERGRIRGEGRWDRESDGENERGGMNETWGLGEGMRGRERMRKRPCPDLLHGSSWLERCARRQTSARLLPAYALACSCVHVTFSGGRGGEHGVRAHTFPRLQSHGILSVEIRTFWTG